MIARGGGLPRAARILFPGGAGPGTLWRAFSAFVDIVQGC